MDPAPTQPTAKSNLSGETPLPQRKPLLDRYEGGLIALLLALVAGTHFSDSLLPGRAEKSLEIVRGEDSARLGPVDLRAPLDTKPLPARDLNTATKIELEAVSGIGPAMAEAILAYREEHGPFRSIEELDRVPGIGPKRVEQFSRHLKVDSAQSQTGESDAADAPASSKPAELSEKAGDLIDLNRAGPEELMRIPGIGEAYAARILEKREQAGGFKSWADVGEVSGIGPKRLENLKAHATID